MKLSRKVTILDASALIASMRQALATGAKLHLDASAVEQIDTCILQLLCAAQTAGQGVLLEHPSRAMVEAIHLCGLQRVMLENEQEAA